MAETDTSPRRWGSILDPHSDTFRSFSDTLLVGVLIVLSAIPVLTVFAGFGAGIQTLRQARETDGHVTFAGFGRELKLRLRRWPSQVVIPTLTLAVLILDALLLPTLLADAGIAQPAVVVLAAAVVTYGVRFAAHWRPEGSAVATAVAAYRAFVSDGTGTLLIAGAIVTAGTLVSIAPMLVVVVAGPVALAAVAVQLRFERNGR